MNEISLIYYGNRTDIEFDLLYLLDVIEVCPATDKESGFYLKEDRFGKIFLIKVTLDIKAKDNSDILIYRYLSPEELLELKENNQNRRVYVLMHNYLSLDYVLEKVLTPDLASFNFIVNEKNEIFKSQRLLKKYIKSNNFFNIVSSHSEKPSAKVKFNLFDHMPVILIIVLKMLINPANELRVYSIRLRYSSLRFLQRFIELLLFMHFIFCKLSNFLFYKIIYYLFYKLNYFRGLIKIAGIKLYFWTKYKVLYWMYYTLWYTVKYRIIYFIYYRIWFVIRHFILLGLFKSYGVFYDLSTFAYRFTKLVLLYPVFKIFWFSRFQYNKRIRKLFYDT